jgi:hypothetical protein
MDSHKAPVPHYRSYLFTVRLWIEELGYGQREVRMQVKHVLSGETRYFRTWPDVGAFLLAKLQEVEAASRREEGEHP